MTPLAWLMGLFLPACGFPGAQGLPPPQPLDLAHIVRPASPNTALAAPAGFTPPPDIITPVYPVPAARLLDSIEKVAAEQPRTFPAANYPRRMQAEWVVRSRLFNFPDLVTAQVIPAGPTESTMVLYSRSVYGYSDLGVNRGRLNTWLSALGRTLPTSSER
jgi:uncharacterized protein (DUF1499 family)